VTSENTILTIDCLKSQDIPAHLKEGFEGYFHQETLQPPVTPLIVLPTVPVTAYKSQPLAATNSLRSPISHNIHTEVGKYSQRDWLGHQMH
jgi:hypothetical protein